MKIPKHCYSIQKWLGQEMALQHLTFIKASKIQSVTEQFKVSIVINEKIRKNVTPQS